MGRPKKWDELNMLDKLILVEGWVRDGLTDEQIAHNLGISTTLLYEWKNEYAEFSECFKRGREVADYLVENAMFRSATGYEYTEDVMKGDFPVTLTKTAHPNVTAQIFWLKNRKSAQWRDKPDSEEKLKKLISLLAKLNLSEDEVADLVNSL